MNHSPLPRPLLLVLSAPALRALATTEPTTTLPLMYSNAMCDTNPTLDDWLNSIDTDALPPFGTPNYPLDLNGTTLDVGDVIEHDARTLDDGRFQLVLDLGDDHFITYDPLNTRYYLKYLDYTEMDVQHGEDGIQKTHHQNVL